MMSEDISNGRERVKVPAVNELNDEKPTAFGVKYLFIFTHVHQCICFNFLIHQCAFFINLWYFWACLPVGVRFRLSSHCSCTKLGVAWVRTLITVLYKTCADPMCAGTPASDLCKFCNITPSLCDEFACLCHIFTVKSN